jgi:biofilm PGA synthesis protein PgaD
VTELVIDAPHLQTHGQRFGTAALLVAGWLLWMYFAFPFLTLCGWWLGIRVCSFWVNLCGGYLSLQKLLHLYGMTVGGLLGGWLGWVLLQKGRRRIEASAGCSEPVTDGELCRAFGVAPETLANGRASRYASVHFDRHGHIVRIEPE